MAKVGKTQVCPRREGVSSFVCVFHQYIWTRANTCCEQAIIPRLRRSVAWLLCRASRLSVLAHTGSDWGRSRQSCSGPLHAWQCVRWPPCPCFFGTSQQHLNLPLPTISLCTTNRVSVSHVFLYVCACSVTNSVLFVFVFTYALSCILYSFNCTILFLLCTPKIRLILCIYWSSPLLLDKYSSSKDRSVSWSRSSRWLLCQNAIM